MNLVIPTPRDHHPHCLIQVFAWHLHICLLQKEWQQAGVGSPFYKHVKHSPSGSILDFISCVCVGFDRPSQYVPYHFSGVENKQKCWIEATPWSGTVYMDGTDDLHLQRKVWSAFSSPSHAAAPHRQQPCRNDIEQLPTRDLKMNNPHLHSVSEPFQGRAASVPASNVGDVGMPISPVWCPDSGEQPLHQLCFPGNCPTSSCQQDPQEAQTFTAANSTDLSCCKWGHQSLANAAC